MAKRRRHSENALYNKLAFAGYHIEGQFDNAVDHCWDDFHDHYPTLEAYFKSFSPISLDVFSPRELYLQQLEDDFYRNITIRDNSGAILWDKDREINAQLGIE